MVKRKREEANTSVQSPSIKRQRVQHKLKLGVTKIAHAFKVAKGFERQKLGKRQKKAAAANDQKTVRRIDSEIAVIKTLDTTASARQHLFKSLLKIQDVSNHPNLPPEVKQPLDLPTDSATLNVQSRLCKANPVTEALNVATLDIKNALDLAAEPSKLSKKRRLRAKDYAADKVEQLRTSNGDIQRGSRPSQDDKDGEDSSSGDESHLDQASDATPDGGSVLDENDIEALERRLASEGFRDSATESGSAEYNLEADLSLSESESDIRTASPEPRKASPSGKSSFVPSLTLGGYVEGSGSDIEDDIGAPRKKNRRGQQARRQIAEMKYGSRANHLQEPNRKAKWDPKRGAVGGRGDRRGRDLPEGLRDDSLRRVNDVAGNSRLSRGDMRREKKPTTKDDSGPIHPSWEAAKKAKQKDAPAAFKGKKITFD